jgi:hypothetical protein
MASKYLLAFVLMMGLQSNAQTIESLHVASVLRVWVQGDTSRLADFVISCKEAFREKGIDFQVGDAGSSFDFNIVVVQESSVSGASGAVIALDRRGQFVASVVRSGRWSGRGALNASAKELAKKLAVLRSQ